MISKFFPPTAAHKKNWLLSSCKAIQILLFILIVIILSLGQIARWDLLDQIAMVDRFNYSGAFYPNKYETQPGGVSVYFPGVAFVTYLVSKFIPNILLVQTMLMVASMIAIVFIFIQLEIAKQIDQSYSGANFWPLAIIFSLLISREWLVYAVEFKPDTVAFLLGSLCLLLSKRKTFSSFASSMSFLLGLMAGLTLLFKQQYISFIIGYFVYYICAKEGRNIHFLIGSIVGAGVVILAMKWHADAWFWTVTVLSDDGFLEMKQWVGDHFIFVFKLCFLIISFLIAKKIFKLGVFNTMNFSMFTLSPWPFIILFGFLASFVSSFKVGGNAGNSAFGLILILPVALVYFSKIKPKIFLVTSLAVIVFQIPKLITSYASYSQASDLADVVTSISNDGTKKLLTGSDVYFASRLRFMPSNYTNYWTILVRDNINDDLKYRVILENLLNNNFDYVIIENWPKNKNILNDSKKYTIIFENPLGIVARASL